MEPKIEKVLAAEAAIADLEAQERKKREEALADDGVIDDKEQAVLDRILGKITKAKAAVAKVRAEIAENKRIWDGKAGELATLKAQVEELETWGHKQAGATRKAFDIVTDKATETLWKGATGELAKAQRVMLKPYADYLAHKAAKATHDPMRADMDARLAAAKASPDQPKTVLANIAKIEAALTKADGAVSRLDFIQARDGLTATQPVLMAVETQLQRLAQDRAAYDEARTVLDRRLAVIRAPKYAVLAPKQAEIGKLTDAVTKAAAGFDFVAARTQANALLPKVDAVIAAQQEQDNARTNFDALAPSLGTALAAVEADTAPESKAARDGIKAGRSAMEALVAKGDYVAALPKQEALATLAGGFEALLAERAAYLARVAELDAQMTEYVVVRGHLAYLDQIVAKISTSRALADARVGPLDYAGALTALDEAEEAISAGDLLIDQRKQAFDNALGVFLPRIEPALACPYAPMKRFSDPLQPQVDRARELADAVDFDRAAEATRELADLLDTFDTELTAYEDSLIARIELRLTAIETDLAAMATPAPSMSAMLPNLIAKIRVRTAARQDLEKLSDDVDEAERMLADLKALNAIITRLAGSAKSNEEAQNIVKELKASKKLFDLPTETRNLLVETLMAGSPPSRTDHKAIQDVWKDRRFVDPIFDKQDKETRDKMIAAMNADPKVTQIKKDWPTLTDAEKEQRVKDITSLVAGPNGWNTGDPTTVEVYKTGTNLGGYAPGSDKLTVNVSRGAIKGDFDEFVATIAHEMAHKYQKQLIDGFNATPATINPGDVEYDQARMLHLEDVYWKTYSAEFDKIYWTSPSENHSRKVDDEVKKGLKDARKAAAEAAKKAGS